MKTISIFCCLLHGMWTVGARINKEGHEWGEVSFRCSHTNAWSNNKYFCKDPCQVSGDKLATVQPGREVKSGNVTLKDNGYGVVTVIISQLQLSDSGRYFCGVDRIGFDTYREVQLTVKEVPSYSVPYTAVINKTTVVPDLSPTWSIPKSTQSTSATLSTAPNTTVGGEQNISTGTVLYAVIGTVAVLTVLVLATCFRKKSKNSKPQPHDCPNSTDLVFADERQFSGEKDNIGEELQLIKEVSERFPCTHDHKQDQSTIAGSAAAECSVPDHVYENICCARVPADSRCSAAHVHDKCDISSGIYIKPLPPTAFESAGDGSLGKLSNKPTSTIDVTSKSKENCAHNASARHSRSLSDSREVRPRSLWFGLDLSGTV